MIISLLNEVPSIELLFLLNSHQLLAVDSSSVTQHKAYDLELATLVVVLRKCAKCPECIVVPEGSIPSSLMLFELSCLWEGSNVNQQYKSIFALFTKFNTLSLTLSLILIATWLVHSQRLTSSLKCFICSIEDSAFTWKLKIENHMLQIIILTFYNV